VSQLQDISDMQPQTCAVYQNVLDSERKMANMQSTVYFFVGLQLCSV